MNINLLNPLNNSSFISAFQMLEKLWEVVAQNVDPQRDSSSKEHGLKFCNDKKSSALTVHTKPQVKPSPTSQKNLHGSLDFSSLPAEKRVKSDIISGPLRKQNTGGKSRILGSGVGYPSVKLTAVKDKDKSLKMERKEAKTDEERKAMTVVPGLKRSAAHNTACTTLISISSESSTDRDSAPTSLITPSTCLASLNKRARECYGDSTRETPKSSTTGLLLKKGLAKQTLSEKKYTAVGCSDGQGLIGIGQSESKTNNQPCKPSNIEPRPVATPTLRPQVKPASVKDEQRQKQDLKKDNNNVTNALASHTAVSQKPKTLPTPTNYSVRLGKLFTTPMGNPRPFTSPSVLRTNVNSPVSPSPVSFNGGGVTPPLCQCGRRARRRCVVNPGPNQGRAFFTCLFNHGRSGLGSNVGKKKSEGGCKFFRWEVRL